MRIRNALFLTAAAFTLSSAAFSQTVDTWSLAQRGVTAETAAGSVPSDRRLRARLQPAGADAANASGRDLSDGVSLSAAVGSSSPSRRAGSSTRLRSASSASRGAGANATGRDLSDSDSPGLTAPPPSARSAFGSQRDRRHAGARVGDATNSPSRDLSDSSFPSTPAPGARGK